MAKYDTDKLKSIFASCKTRKAFIEKVAKQGVSEGYASTLWQNWKKSGAGYKKPFTNNISQYSS